VRVLTPAIVVLAFSVALFGCQSAPPQGALKLPPQSLNDRKLQTRRFDGIAEADLLAASAAVLQDLGFNLDETEAGLGVIVASKQRSAHVAGAAKLAKLLDWFLDIELEVDKEQRIRASLVSRPAGTPEASFLVRVTFQRIVWNTRNEISKQQALNEPELYQKFFDRLSKSVFLEAHSI